MTFIQIVLNIGIFKRRGEESTFLSGIITIDFHLSKILNLPYLIAALRSYDASSIFQESALRNFPYDQSEIQIQWLNFGLLPLQRAADVTI